MSLLVMISCKRNIYTKAVNMEFNEYYEYFDYISFAGMNKRTRLEYPCVSIDTLNNNSIILNIHLNDKKYIQKLFERKESFFVNQEVMYKSLDSVIHEDKVSIYIPDNKVIEYHFITDASNISKLVLVKIIGKNYEEQYEPDQNPNLKMDNIPMNVNNPIWALEKKLNISFNITKYKYSLEGETLYKIKENEEVVETYFMKGLDPFYKDYLQYIK